MLFANDVKPRYRDAIEEALQTILAKGNERHIQTAASILESDLLIRFVPLAKIGCSGVTGLISARKTNRRINNETIDVTDALREVHITFADWTFDVAGQRGCQGTLVHEGLHACDFAKVISTFSNADKKPLEVFDLSLYELEHRAAITSAEYLVLIGKEDFIDDGLQLNLVGLDAEGRPFVDMEGIKLRMESGYGVSEHQQGIMISRLLALRRQGERFSWSRFLRFSA